MLDNLIYLKLGPGGILGRQLLFLGLGCAHIRENWNKDLTMRLILFIRQLYTVDMQYPDWQKGRLHCSHNKRKFDPLG